MVELYSRRRENEEACGRRVAPLIVIGFSDGATTIYNVLTSGNLNGRIDFLGMVDMVRTSTFSIPNSEPMKALSFVNQSRFFHRGYNAFQQSSGLSTDGWKGHLLAAPNMTNVEYSEVWSPPSGFHHKIAHIDSALRVGIIRQPVVQWDIIYEAIR